MCNFSHWSRRRMCGVVVAIVMVVETVVETVVTALVS